MVWPFSEGLKETICTQCSWGKLEGGKTVAANWFCLVSPAREQSRNLKSRFPSGHIVTDSGLRTFLESERKEDCIIKQKWRTIPLVLNLVLYDLLTGTSALFWILTFAVTGHSSHSLYHNSVLCRLKLSPRSSSRQILMRRFCPTTQSFSIDLFYLEKETNQN